jgi:hypothetical protein
MKQIWRLAAVGTLTLSAVCWPHAQELQPPSPAVRLAVPIEPVPAIVEAFRSHPIVTLGDAHGVEQVATFELSVVRDPRIRGIVNDVVIENGNARYQDVMDRFVRGENVSYQMLRHVWDETTQPQAGIRSDVPALYRLIRDVNVNLPPAQRLRVLLGDPPIDWARVRSREDYDKWLIQRDTYPAEMIEREVIAKKRHALVIYGQVHTQRKNVLANYEIGGAAETVIGHLERRTGIRAFTIWWSDKVAQLQPDAASWPVPSLALIRGTPIGSTDFAVLYSSGRYAIKDGKVVPIPKEQWRTVKTEELFDAILYLGDRITTLPAPADVCADKGYIETRLARMKLADLPARELDVWKKLCGLPN